MPRGWSDAARAASIASRRRGGVSLGFLKHSGPKGNGLTPQKIAKLRTSVQQGRLIAASAARRPNYNGWEPWLNDDHRKWVNKSSANRRIFDRAARRRHGYYSWTKPKF